MDAAAVLGGRVPEVSQQLSLGPGSLSCSTGIERTRKCLQGEPFVRCCDTVLTSCFSGSFPGVAKGVQQLLATQTLRVRLLGVDKFCQVHNGSWGPPGVYNSLHRPVLSVLINLFMTHTHTPRSEACRRGAKSWATKEGSALRCRGEIVTMKE